MEPPGKQQSRKYFENQSSGQYAGISVSYDSRHHTGNTASYLEQTYRVRGIHKHLSLQEVRGLLQGIFAADFDSALSILSLAVDATDLQSQVAVVSFRPCPMNNLDHYGSNFGSTLNYQERQFDLPVNLCDEFDGQNGLPRSHLLIDTEFLGFTSLYTPEPESHTVE